MSKNNLKTMQEVLEKRANDIVPIKLNSTIEVNILAKSKNKILVDVAGITQGFIPEKEFSQDASELKAGDKILAYVLSVENDDGLTVLSLKRAEKDRFVKNLQEKADKEESITVHIKQANRGGLMAEYGSIEGFLPVSQLASNHYPRVGDDKEKIIGKLNELVGKNLTVKILSLDDEANKLVFSEKAASSESIAKKISKYKVGDKIEGKITGVADFGVFVELDEGVEGLVHISEISWDRISNLKDKFRIGDKIKVEIISIEANKISLSMKRLLLDPWLDKIKDFKVGQKISGKIIKITAFGIFVELKNDTKGLTHISELVEAMKEKKANKIEDLFSLDEKYSFKISEIDKNNHKINLILDDSHTKNTKKKKATKKS